MIDYIVNSRSRLFWLLFHLSLGALSALSPWVVIAWFYFAFITSIWKAIKPGPERFFLYTSLIVYSVSFELTGRMAGASPFIPWELGKYLLFVLLIGGIMLKYRKGTAGFIMLLLLVPGLLIDMSGQVWFKNIVFNLLGPVNVALAVIYFRRQEISGGDFVSLLRLLLYTSVMPLAFVIVKRPDFTDVEFTLSYNFETSGGFGPNQVSTIFGMASFLLFVFIKNRWHFSGHRWLDFIILVLFVLRGLLTFSRGGMLGGAFAILIILLYEMNYYGSSKISAYSAMIAKSSFIILFFVLLFLAADNITGGNLVLRYRGETPGTLAGYKEKNLNVFLANRLDVLKDDIKLWKEYPVLGAGAGASFYLRENTVGIASGKSYQ